MGWKEDKRDAQRGEGLVSANRIFYAYHLHEMVGQQLRLSKIYLENRGLNHSWLSAGVNLEGNQRDFRDLYEYSE